MFRRYLAILFISLYAIGNTELHEVLRFPLLVEHFLQHRAQNPEITVGQFLYMHYLQPQPKDKDYKKDMQLPFKSDVSSIFHVVVFTPIAKYATNTSATYSERSYMVRNTSFIPLYTGKNIWQPPRA